MATLLTAPDLPSSDDEDTDFVPGQDPTAQPRSKKRKAPEADAPSNSTAAHKLSNGGSGTQPDARTGVRSERRAAKVDAVWQALSAANRPAAGSSKTVSLPQQPTHRSSGSTGAGFSLASLCGPVQKSKPVGQRQVWPLPVLINSNGVQECAWVPLCRG